MASRRTFAGCFAAVYAALLVGWVVPWLQVGRDLEPFAVALLVGLHVCFAALVGSFAIAASLPPVATSSQTTGDKRFCAGCRVWHAQAQLLYYHPAVLEQCVGPNNWAAFGWFLLSGSVCAWSVSLGAILRLCEMAGVVHVGPMAPGTEVSLLVLCALLCVEIAAALVLPMFGLSFRALLQWRASQQNCSKSRTFIRMLVS
jgi:hypothetical protein